MHSAIIAAAAAKETTFTDTWSLAFSHSSIVPRLHPKGVFAHSLLDERDSYCGIVHIVRTSFLRLCEAVAEKSFHLYRYIKSEKLSPKMQKFLKNFYRGLLEVDCRLMAIPLFAINSHIDKCKTVRYTNLQISCKLEGWLMARYLTRQRKQLLEYLSEHTDEQMTARQIADALTAESISISAVYRNLSALEEEGILKRSIRENTREVYYQYIAAEECKDSLHLSCRVCGKSIHLGEKEAEQLLQSTLESTGFQIDKTETILYGVCVDCRK